MEVLEDEKARRRWALDIQEGRPLLLLVRLLSAKAMAVPHTVSLADTVSAKDSLSSSSSSDRKKSAALLPTATAKVN